MRDNHTLISLPKHDWRLSSSLLMFLLFSSSLMLGSCSDGAESGVQNHIDFGFFTSSGRGLPPTSTPIDALRVTVVDTNNQSVVSQQVLTRDSNGRSVLKDVPFGEGLQFFFEALDASDNTLVSGGTRAFDLNEDNERLLQLYAFTLKVGEVARVSALYGQGEVAESDFIDEFGASSPRAGHQTLVLQDGRILVIGGAKYSATEGDGMGGGSFTSIYDSILVYDMNKNGGYFDLAMNGVGTVLRMSGGRVHHTATLLSSGQVLIVGGFSSADGQSLTTLSSVELLTPNADGSFELTLLGNMNVARSHHTTNILDDQRVLIVGGESAITGAPDLFQNTAEIFDVALKGSARLLPLSGGRSRHSAVSLNEGQVLLCGGRNLEKVLSGCELYQETNGLGSMIALPGNMSAPRYAFSMLRLEQNNNQYILLAGGFKDLVGGVTDSLDLFDIQLGGFVPGLGLSLPEPRANFTLQPLHLHHDILAIGGIGEGGVTLNSLSLLRPQTEGNVDYFGQAVGRLQQGRFDHDSVMLPSGMVLITGGAIATGNTTSNLASCEIYNAGLPAIVVNASQ